eukprot:scaffold42800_cov52-Attheya_sp.AAC.3
MGREKRTLYREANATTAQANAITPGHQKQWKRGFHMHIGACMTGECIREGQWQLRLKAVDCEGYGDMPSVAEGSCGAASGRMG